MPDKMLGWHMGLGQVAMTRFAMVGCGAWAERYVSVANRVAGATFTAAVDSRGGLAESCGRALGADLISTSLDDLLNSHADAVDAVVIATPNNTHALIAEQAARAGKHVLVEAPIGLDLASTDVVIEACRGANVRLMVGAAMRFAPAALEVRNAVDNGEVGIPGLMRTHRWASAADHPADSWQLDATLSGGPFIHEAMNEIGLAGWLFGGPAETVFGLASYIQPAEHCVQVHLGYTGGAMALIDFATTMPPGDGYRSFALIGSAGSVYADDHQNVQLNFRGGHADALVTPGTDAAIQSQLQEFVDAIEQDRDPMSNGSESRTALQVATAALQSAGSGQTFRWRQDGYEPV